MAFPLSKGLPRAYPSRPTRASALASPRVDRQWQSGSGTLSPPQPADILARTHEPPSKFLDHAADQIHHHSASTASLFGVSNFIFLPSCASPRLATSRQAAARDRSRSPPTAPIHVDLAQADPPQGHRPRRQRVSASFPPPSPDPLAGGFESFSRVSFFGGFCSAGDSIWMWL
jgi:hypothetical protein